MTSCRVSLVLSLLMLASLPLYPIHQAAADSYTNISKLRRLIREGD